MTWEDIHDRLREKLNNPELYTWQKSFLSVCVFTHRRTARKYTKTLTVVFMSWKMGDFFLLYSCVSFSSLL